MGRIDLFFRICSALVLVSSVVACGDDGSAGGGETATTTRPQSQTTAPEESTTTSSSTPTTTQTGTTAPVGDLGTLEDPVPVGEVVQMGEWRIRVRGVTPDATQQVLEENAFNEPPAEGRQFFMVHLQGAYAGTESSNFWVDVMMKPVGPSNVAYEGMEDRCGVIPNEIDEAGETFPGGVIEGNACWSVTAEDANGLVLLVEESLSFSGARAYLSLDPDAQPVQSSVTEGVEGFSRLDQAVPVGEGASVGPWNVTVTDVVANATDAILAENQSNEPPGEGEQFYMATLEASFEGDESSTFWIDMSLKAVGDSSVAYEGFEGSCGVIPDPIDETGETFPGGSISGNVCWKVDSQDVGSLVMIAEETFSFEGERVFFSLTP